MNREVDFTQAKRYIPPAFCSVIKTAMAKQPAQRFQTSSEFAQQLRKLQHSLLDTESPPPNAAAYQRQSVSAVKQPEFITTAAA